MSGMPSILICKGCKWRVLNRFSIMSLPHEREKYGNCRVYYPGDIIRDRYFCADSWHIKKGAVSFITFPDRTIDDEWES